MCKWRLVSNDYTGCGHVYSLPGEEIHCENIHCKFSPNHPRDCGRNCRRTCSQYHQFPEQHTRTIGGRCPSCVGSIPGPPTDPRDEASEVPHITLIFKDTDEKCITDTLSVNDCQSWQSTLLIY
ncbi:hypothetical protein DFH09DRAFT_186012 [Mycena vulgaris]|nr:hypothetical protein DFH09DRAFT_186012 [Mycena vulgaris]